MKKQKLVYKSRMNNMIPNYDQNYDWDLIGNFLNPHTEMHHPNNPVGIYLLKVNKRNARTRSPPSNEILLVPPPLPTHNCCNITKQARLNIERITLNIFNTLF